MADLAGRSIASSYKELLKTESLTGVTSGLTVVEDGDGTTSALQISSSAVRSAGTLEAAGATTLLSTLSVAGASTLTGAVNMAGNLTVSGNTVIQGTLTGQFSDLNVNNITATSLILSSTSQSANKDTGALVIEGGVGIDKNTNIGGSLGVTGATNLSSTLTVNGATTLSSNLGVTGDLAVNTSKFNVMASSGNTTVAGTLNVSGAATLTGGLGVTGATTINGQLGATSIQNTPIGSVTPATGSFTTGEFTQVDVKAAGQLRLQDTTGGEYVGFAAPGTVTSSYALTMPPAQGGVGSTLINDGSGILSWQIPGGGGGGSQISAGDSSFLVSDTGSGTINAVIDGSTRSTFTTGEYHISTKLRANELDNTPIGVTTPAAGNFNQVNIKSRNELRFEDTTGGDYVGIRAPSAVGTSYTISLPTAQGGVGSSLVNDGAGNLNWQVAGGGGGSSISAGDSSVSVIDSGSGTISHVVDGATKLSLNSTTLANTGNITNTGTFDTTGNLSVGSTKFVVDGATGNVTTTALTTLELTTEIVSDLSGATGTVVHDLSTASVFNHNAMAANFTANFTNAPTTDSRSIVATLLLQQNATARFPTVVQLNGVTQLVNWANNIIPTGTANKKEIVSFTFIRNSSGGTTCLGNYISYG